VVGGDTHEDGVNHLMFGNPKIGSSKKNFSLIQRKENKMGRTLIVLSWSLAV
jgi:hypothetical protein